MYSRPSIHTPEFRNDEGDPIPYGEQWAPSYEPPLDSYERVSNPQRFLPLHTVANALIDHLLATYETTLIELGSETEYVDATVRHVAVGLVSTPADRIEFVLTGYPSAGVRLDAMTEMHYPVCSCDACDETWEYGAQMLEDHVLQRAAFWPRRDAVSDERAGTGRPPTAAR